MKSLLYLLSRMLYASIILYFDRLYEHFLAVVLWKDNDPIFDIPFSITIDSLLFMLGIIIAYLFLIKVFHLTVFCKSVVHYLKVPGPKRTKISIAQICAIMRLARFFSG